MSSISINNNNKESSSRKSLRRQSSSGLNSISGLEDGTIAIGIDWGSYNARVGIYDEQLQHPSVVSNHDGHRMTKVVLEEPPLSEEGAAAIGNNENSPEAKFYQGLMDLAASAAHTKDLHVVVSVPNSVDDTWIQTALREQDPTKPSEGLLSNARIITEAAAVCLAYEKDDTTEDVDETIEPTTTLVIDGGNRGIKATLVSKTSSGIWKLDVDEQILKEVNATSLIEPLGQFVAQQFTMKHRFPRGEVWESKKARTKIMNACMVGLKTLYINKSSAPIHVDGLYEGIDYQVSVSKPKWEHLSGKLVRATKEFLTKFNTDNPNIDRVLISGGLFTWLTPIVQGVFGNKVQQPTTYFDPSEAIAMGCTKQAYYNLESSTILPTATTTTINVPIAPVSIGIVVVGDDENKKDKILIEKGTPLPAMVVTQPLSNTTNTSSFEVWQKEPTSKALCKIEELTDLSTLKLQMTKTGALRVWVDGETLAF